MFSWRAYSNKFVSWKSSSLWCRNASPSIRRRVRFLLASRRMPTRWRSSIPRSSLSQTPCQASLCSRQSTPTSSRRAKSPTFKNNRELYRKCSPTRFLSTRLCLNRSGFTTCLNRSTQTRQDQARQVEEKREPSSKLPNSPSRPNIRSLWHLKSMTRAILTWNNSNCPNWRMVSLPSRNSKSPCLCHWSPSFQCLFYRLNNHHWTTSPYKQQGIPTAGGMCLTRLMCSLMKTISETTRHKIDSCRVQHNRLRLLPIPINPTSESADSTLHNRKSRA